MVGRISGPHDILKILALAVRRLVLRGSSVLEHSGCLRWLPDILEALVQTEMFQTLGFLHDWVSFAGHCDLSFHRLRMAGVNGSDVGCI